MCNIPLCNVSNILHFKAHDVTKEKKKKKKKSSWDFMPEEAFENKQVKFSVAPGFYVHLHKTSFFFLKKKKFLIAI